MHARGFPVDWDDADLPRIVVIFQQQWDAMVRSEGHEMIVDDYLREMALRHPEQRAWTETLALRYERWEEGE